MNTRLAEPADAAAIADLVRLAFSRQSRPTNPPSSASRETAATIGDHLRRGGAAVVEREGEIVGALLWGEEDGVLYLSRLAVHPAIAGKESPGGSSPKRSTRRSGAG